jgi:hypothetical protein
MSVAELSTFQDTVQPGAAPPLIVATDEAVFAVKALPICKTNGAS